MMLCPTTFDHIKQKFSTGTNSVGEVKFYLYPVRIFWLDLSIKLTYIYVDFTWHGSPHNEMKTQGNDRTYIL